MNDQTQCVEENTVKNWYSEIWTISVNGQIFAFGFYWQIGKHHSKIHLPCLTNYVMVTGQCHVTCLILFPRQTCYSM